MRIRLTHRLHPREPAVLIGKWPSSENGLYRYSFGCLIKTGRPSVTVGNLNQPGKNMGRPPPPLLPDHRPDHQGSGSQGLHWFPVPLGCTGPRTRTHTRGSPGVGSTIKSGVGMLGLKPCGSNHFRRLRDLAWARAGMRQSNCQSRRPCICTQVNLAFFVLASNGA